MCHMCLRTCIHLSSPKGQCWTKLGGSLQASQQSRNILNLHAVHATVSFAKLQKWHAKLLNFSSFEVWTDTCHSPWPGTYKNSRDGQQISALQQVVPGFNKETCINGRIWEAGVKIYVRLHTFASTCFVNAAEQKNPMSGAFHFKPCILYGVLTTNTSVPSQSSSFCWQIDSWDIYYFQKDRCDTIPVVCHRWATTALQVHSDLMTSPSSYADRY